MSLSYIGLGSNIGDRVNYLKEAITVLNRNPSVEVNRCSSIYETDPYGPVSQPPFLNMAIEIETSLPPLNLLQLTQSVENQLKRERKIHWGPRTIDLDILLYADKMLKLDTLIVPHPEITKRLFVLIPLRELDSNMTLPGVNKSIQELCERFKDQKGVRLWKENIWGGEFGLFEN